MHDIALIVGCSKDKGEWDEPMPAIEVYQGVFARMLRSRNPAVEIFFLSAKHGLLHSSDRIVAYDDVFATMPGRAWIERNVVERWEPWRGKFKEVYHMFLVPSLYWAVLSHLERVQEMKAIEPDMRAIGLRLHALKEFCKEHVDG